MFYNLMFHNTTGNVVEFQVIVNFIPKYMKYFINFLKNVKFNSVHSVNSVQRWHIHR